MGLMKRAEDGQTDLEVSAEIVNQLSSDDTSRFKSASDIETISSKFSPDLVPRNDYSHACLDAAEGIIRTDLGPANEDSQKLEEPRSDATDSRTSLDPTVIESFNDVGPTSEDSQMHPGSGSNSKVSEMLLDAMKDISNTGLGPTYGDYPIREDCCKDLQHSIETGNEVAQDITQVLHQTVVTTCTEGNQEQNPGDTHCADFRPSHDHGHIPLETINVSKQRGIDDDQSRLEYDTDLSSNKDLLDESMKKGGLSQKPMSNFEDSLLLESGSSKLETQIGLQTSANGNIVNVLNVDNSGSGEEALDMYASKDENYV